MNLNRLHRTLRNTLLGAILATAVSACNQNPTDDVATRPADAAAQAPATAPAAPAAAPSPDSSIFYAQVGSKLNDAGYIAESLTKVAPQDAIYAMSVFRGKDGDTGEAGVSVVSSDGKEIFKETKPYTIKGETAVVFDVAAAGAGTAAGDYKVVFTCNGGPCWEVPFSVK